MLPNTTIGNHFGTQSIVIDALKDATAHSLHTIISRRRNIKDKDGVNYYLRTTRINVFSHDLFVLI